MKKFFILLISILFTTVLYAQTVVVFHEDLELPSGGDSLMSTADSAGVSTTSFTPWSLSTHLAKSGLRSDSNRVQSGKTVYLTSTSFSTVGKTNVLLEFAQICKLHFIDGGQVDVSIDGGTNWTTLSNNEYLGTGLLMNNMFSESSYYSWIPGDTLTKPTNAWWKNEKFNISAIAANQTNVKIRFKYIGSGNPLGNGRYGWLLDNIKVTAGNNELIVPTAGFFNPILNDTVYVTGPLTVKVYAKDSSGIGSVQLNYSLNGGTYSLINMTNTSDSNYTADIPSTAYNNSISYYIAVSDINNNITMLPSNGTNTFYVKKGPATVNVGTGTTTGLFSPVYIAHATDANLYSYNICLFDKNEILSGGTIESLAFNKADVNGYNLGNATLRIYIKGTLATSVPINYNDYAAAKNGAVKVYENTAQNINTTAGWQTFMFNTGSLYDYNGSENLMVFIEWYRPGNATGPVNWLYNTVSGKAITFYGVASTPTTTNASEQRAHIKFNFQSSNAAIDAKVLSFSSPAYNITANVNNPVSVRIRNLGSTTLTSANIHWTVDGVYKGMVAWTGSLAQDFTGIPLSLGNVNLGVGVHTFKAWTALPNGVADQQNANDTAVFSVFACGNMSGIYTVGSSSSDFPTLNNAIDAINNCGVSGPVTFKLAAGIYNSQLVLNLVNNVSAINTITFESASGNNNDVILQHSATGNFDNYVLRFSGSRYVKVKNLTINARGTTHGRVVEFINGAKNCTLEGCILNMPQTTSQNYAGVYSTTTTNELYNTIKNNVINGGYYGIYFYSSSSMTEIGNVFEGNIIKDYYYYGIQVFYQDSVIVNKNVINNSLSSAIVHAISSSFCNNASYLKNKISLRNLSSTSYGLYMNSSNIESGKSLVANNWISQSMSTAGAISGIHNLNSKNVSYYYNSVNITAGPTTGYAFYSSGSSSTKLKNNIFVNKIGYAFYISTTGQIDSSNYNNIYGGGTNYAYWGAACPNLAALQALSLKDQNSISVDPLFYSINDLHITNYSLIAAGSQTSSVTEDIDGETRANPPTIGADEIVVPLADAGVIKINNPLNNITVLNQNIRISLKHIGSAALTSATIKWSVNGIMQTPYPWTGNLAQFAVDTTVVIGNYTFNYGISTIKVWTELPNNTTDVYPQNDSISLVLNACNGPLSGNYTIGGTTADYPDINSAVFALKNCGVNGPTTFNINPGTYNEQIVFSNITGASASNTITFKSANNDSSSVVIDAGNCVLGNYAVKFDGGSYYTLRKLTIQNIANFGKTIELINAANYITITNCVVKSCQTSPISSAYAIYSNNTREDNTSITNNLVLGGYMAIYLYGNSSSMETGNMIQNNIVKDFSNFGIVTYYQDGIKVIGNLIQNHPLATTSYALYSYSNDNINFQKNDIRVNCSGITYGMYIRLNNTLAGSGLVANNFVSQSSGTGNVWGIFNFSSNNMNYYNNSINITGGTLTSYGFQSTTGNAINLVNNIFCNTGGGYALYVTAAASVNTCDYNDIYSTGANYAYWGAACTNLAALKTTSAKNTNSISINPFFLSVNDLHTEYAGLWANGTALAEVTDDIDGQTRAALPCIGADEFVVYPNDASVKALYTYGKLPIGAGTPHSIKAIVKNKGINNLSNVNLTLNISGANTFNNVKTIASFLSGQEDTITFDPYSPSNLGFNNVKVSFPSDNNLTNNELNYYQITTDSIFAYADTSAATSSLGFNSSGLLLAKYYISSSKVVSSITSFITNNNTIGQTLYAVVLDVNGNLIDTSFHKIITANDTNSWVTFTMSNPMLSLTLNNYIYAGIAQTLGTTAYYPLGSQKENPCRRNSFYTSGSLIGGTLLETTTNGRFMIQLNLGSALVNEASVSEIIAPNTACGLGNEIIQIKIQNGGLFPIYGGQNVLMAHYGAKVNGNIVNIVNQQVTDTILPSQFKIFSFTTPKNMAVTTADSNFNLVAWVDLLNDPLHSNDTITKIVKSRLVPNVPVVNSPVSVGYGGSLTLTTVAQDAIRWYANLTDTVAFYKGSSYITPQLYTNTTYFVKSAFTQGFNNNLALSAASYNSSGGATGYGPDLYNDGIIPPYGTLGSGSWGWTSDGGWIEYTWPTVKNFNKVVFYNDSKPMTSCTFQYWDGSAYVNFYNYMNVVNYQQDSVTFPMITSSRIRFYNVQSPNINPNFREIQVFEAIVDGCSSAPIPYVINIINGADATVKKIISPSTACGIVNQNVSIRIKNQGNLPIIGSANSLSAKYGIRLNNNIINVVSQQVTNTINAGDSLDFTFTIPVTLPANTSDSNYTIVAWTTLTNDLFTNNDTLSKSIVSRYIPSAPIANAVSIPFATAATLNATSGSPVEWYKTMASDSVIFSGPSFTTPLMYTTDTFYVAANTSPLISATLGTDSTNANTTISWPTPYGQYFNGSKEQYLIKASELIAMGFSSGNISSLAFDVVTPPGYALNNYSIKMGHTSQPILVSWESGLTQVYANSNLMPVTGWNTYIFSTPFVWNGIDNIIIECCFDNYPLGFTTNGIVNRSITTFVSAMNYHSNSGNVCTTGGAPTQYNIRPNMKLQGYTQGCSSPKTQVVVVVGNIPALDISISSITQPSGIIISGTPIPVKAKLYNYGSTTVNSATIKWSVNGVQQINVPLTGLNLSTGQSTIVSLGNYTFAGGPSVIKVWSSAPNASTDLYPLNDTTTANVISCMTGNFTIGTGGTFPTFTAAINTMYLVGVCGNVVFDVLPGTYNEALFVTHFNGAGPNATVTFRSQNANNASVILTNATALATLELHASSYINFEKITISASGNTNAAVQISNGCTHNVFDGNIIRNLNNSSSVHRAINCTNLRSDNYNIFLNNTISGGYYGINWNGSSAYKKLGNVFSNNTIKDFSYYGMLLYYADSVIITKNTITNASNASTAYGLFINYSEKSYITKNRINLNATSVNNCLYLNYCNTSNLTGSLVANNFITQSVGTGNGHGIISYFSSNVNYYNNSINVIDGSSSYNSFYINGGTGCNIVNNIFSNTGGGYAYYASSVASINISNYNDIYATGTNYAYWGNNVVNLAALKTASGKDFQSVSVNPYFSSDTNLHLINFNLNGIGTPVAGVIDDIDDDVRNSTTPDIGADEFNLPLNDAGVIAVYAPLSPTTAGSQSVKVILKNFGSTNLTSASIRWSADGLMQTAFPWTGNLISGGLDTVNIGAYNFLSGHSNTIKVWPTLPNGGIDGLATNDTTISSIIACSGGLAGTYTIGGIAANFTSFSSAVQALTYCGVNAAVTFNVNPGIYTEQFIIGSINGASATNRITFQSANGDSNSVIIGFDYEQTWKNYVVQLSGTQYVTLRKMSFIQTNLSNGRVITFTGSPSNIIIANNRIEMPVSTVGTSVGIHTLNSDFGNDNMLLNNYILNGYNAIVANANAGNSKRNIIEGNIINAFHNYGIQADYQDSCVIRKNVISCNNIASGKRAITMIAATNNLFIDKNKINMSLAGSAMYGIYITSSNGTVLKPQLIANNFVTINGSTGYGIFVSSGNYVCIANNSLNTNMSNTGSSSVALNLNGGSNNRLYNNNVVALNNEYVVFVSNASSISNSNNNNFYKATAVNYAFWESTAINLTALKAISNQDSNSVSLNPNYLSASDLHVYSISMNNIGKHIPEVSDDIDGQLRSSTTPDIGADEYSPFQYDLASIAFLEPGLTYSQAGGNINVKAVIKNYGIDSIANFNVVCKFGNAAPVNILHSNYLLANKQDTIIFTNLPVTAGPAVIQVYTDLNNDGNRNNDTIKMNYFGMSLKNIPYAENFDNTVNEWFSPNQNTLWQKGAPSSSLINTAHTAPNVWKTNLTANYVNNISDTLYTPIFDNSLLIADTMKFWHWINTELNKDGGYIDYTADGINWSRLGQIITIDTNGSNWYNGLTNWWTGSFTGWQQSKYRVKNLTLTGNYLQFRFIFTSDATNNAYNGWAIDDFEITLSTIPFDAGVVAITSPPSNSLVGDLTPVTVSIKNFGTAVLTNIPVKYQVGSGASVAGIYPGPLAAGATANYTFTQSYQVAVNNFTICAYTEVSGDIYTINDKTCKFVTVNPAPNDVSITEINIPGNYASQGPTPVKVLIKNKGTSTQTAIPVSYRRGTQTPVDETWTGSLAAGDSIYYTFTTLMTVPAGSSFNLCSYSRLANDVYKLNDTICKIVTICSLAAPGTIVGLSTVALNTNNVMYRITVPITGATSYNWYFTGTGVTLNYDGNNKDTAYLNFGATATSGVLSVKAWNGICEGAAATLSIAVGVGIENIDASNFWLAQNMPNPTTGSTNIEYSLPTSGLVKFDILNLYGQKVYSTNSIMDAGKHLINLNLNDIAAGVYYYTIEFKGKRLVKKMVLNK